MTPEQLAAISAANAEEAERAKATARPAEPGWGDTVAQLDSAGQLAELAFYAGGMIWDGVCAIGRGAGAVCKAADSVIPRID